MVETVRRQALEKRRVLVKASASVLAAEESRAASHRSFWGGVTGRPFLQKGPPRSLFKKLSDFAGLSTCPAHLHPSASDCLLEAPIGGMVKALTAYGLREVLLVHFCAGVIVSITISLAVAQFLHQAGRRIADMQRNRKRPPERPISSFTAIYAVSREFDFGAVARNTTA